MPEKTDFDKLVEVLKETGVPHEVDAEGDEIVWINADASDKYVSVIFEDGKYSYSN